jgi:membrane-bound lytic murein transglycosylase D
MIKLYSKGIFLAFLFIVLLGGCSATKLTTEAKEEKTSAVNPDDYLLAETTAFSITDTTHIQKEIESKLEIARQHYVSALESNKNDDSANSVKEFEEAIKVLDQLSYYPDIEYNEEFNELSKSLIDDYEKFVVSIDELGPETPIFALREKINTEAVLIDVNKEKIPIPKELPKTQVPLVINEPVKQFISFFMDRGQKFLPSWFFRSGYYFPMMKRIFAEEGLPQELIYLSLIESGLAPTARSKASAVGLWQFIRSTGNLYGLKGDFWIDDRRNPEKATRAAAKHLKDLYDIYQDWYLVLAAYNSGGGRVNSAIRRGRSNDYWEISKKLPLETRGYVPQYIAISLIFLNPEQYGFENMQYASPLESDTVMINGCYDLDVLANAAKADPDQLKLLNPDLVQTCTPPSMIYPLKIPKDKTEIFVANLKQIPPEKRRTYLVHNVKKGETIGSIAQKYNISKSLLVDLNGLEKYAKSKKKLPKGISIKIPIKPSGNLLASASVNNPPQATPAAVTSVSTPEVQDTDADTDESTVETSSDKVQNSPDEQGNEKLQGESSKSKIVYHVKQSDNLKSIASMYDVRISDIRNWNDIPFGQEANELDSIDIWIPKSKLALYQNINGLNSSEKSKLVSTKTTIKPEKENGWLTHKVKKNETLKSIADKYDVSVNSLKKWNGLKKNSIAKGKTIKIYTQSAANDLYASSKKTTKKSEYEHKVEKKETLYSIAKKNDITVKELLEWNNMTEDDKLKTGQTLKLSQPSSTKNAEPKLAKQVGSKKKNSTDESENFSSYKVKKGDNLGSIAEAYGVNPEDIRKWNKINGDNIKLGQTLKLHASVPTTSKGDNEKPKTTGKKEYYKVKSGDTLYGISKKFKIEIAELKKWNKISDLKAGEKLVIYR